MPVEPLADLGVLVGGVIVKNDVHRFFCWNLGVDSVEEANELLVAMTLHVASDDGASADVKCGEERCCAIAFAIMGHRAEPPLLQRQARLGPVQRLDPGLLINRQDNGVGGRIDIEADNVAQFIDEVGIVGELELPAAMGLKPVRPPDAPDRAGADADRSGHHVRRPVCRLPGRVFQRQRHNAFGHVRTERGNTRGSRFVSQKALKAANCRPDVNWWSSPTELVHRYSQETEDQRWRTNDTNRKR